MSKDATMDKLLGRKKIEKLDISLLTKTTEDFRKAKLAHIKECINVGKSKAWAEADFDQQYPDLSTFNAFKGDKLTSYGQQQLIDKINEIIDVIEDL